MSSTSHLWAIGYDDTARAEEARDEITRLAGPQQYLLLFDTAILVRYPDGSDRQPLSPHRAGQSGYLLMWGECLSLCVHKSRLVDHGL